MQKCMWCNKKNNELREISIPDTNSPLREISYFVCPEHEQKFRKFYDYARRYGPLFIGLVVLSLISFIISASYEHFNLSMASFASMGLIMIIFPFCTPQTIAMVGVAKSIIIARIIGGIFFFTSGVIEIAQNLLHGS